MAEIVGERSVSDGAAERHTYSLDMTENPPREPLMVVMPASTEEVVQVVRLANETRTPLVPFVAGQNVGGLTIPQVDGAVVVDLKRMDRVVEVDEDAMYAVVEPGVTFGHLRRFLDQHHPSLRYTYPLAPPFTSVVANALLQGLCDLSTRHGAMADFINGLEVVLPTGEVVRVGSGVMGDGYWYARYPLPDLVGLFTGWQGMTGIVTRAALQLWPRPPCTRHAAVFTFGEETTTRLLSSVARAGLVDDADCLSVPIVKMLLGVDWPVEHFEGEPDYATLLTMTGNTEREAEEKCTVVEDMVEAERRHDPRNVFVPWEVVRRLMGPQADSWVDFPSDAFKVLTRFDGLTWVGTYIHPRHWAEALRGGRRVVERHGFELMAFLKPMRGMHFGEFKFIIRFPKDPATLARVRACNEELLELALGLGAVPYKTPVWAARRLQERVDPQFVELLRRIRRLLDPNGIMNPGRWAL